jgi:HlyD family secretion protein
MTKALAVATIPVDVRATVDGSALRDSLRGPMRVGGAVISVFLIGFGTWGALVPLAGGAVAPGVVSPDGSKRTVQHLEGGIVERIHVREGDQVVAGQPMVDLASLQSRAAYEAFLGQYRSMLASQARLLAEQAGAAEIAFPDELAGEPGDAALKAVLDGQRELFRTRREAHVSRQRVLRQRIEQQTEQIKALQAQVDSTRSQAALIRDELEGKQALFAKGMLAKPELRRLERTSAEIGGRHGEALATIAKVKEQIGETQLQIVSLGADRADEIAGKLSEVRTELATLREKLVASRDVLKRTVVTAPLDGSVVNLRAKTVGGVIRSGEVILDLVPANETLLIDARIAPTDVDVVHPGLEAQVKFPAFSARSLPVIRSVVRTVSADRMTDERTNLPYFLARVEVERSELDKLPNVQLVAGMPAEVLIVTSNRTMWAYLLQPLLDVLWRGMREV